MVLKQTREPFPNFGFAENVKENGDPNECEIESTRGMLARIRFIAERYALHNQAASEQSRAISRFCVFLIIPFGNPHTIADMNRAVIYCRVSTKDQVENFSLATQQKACVEFCARNNFAVEKIFIEEGESAKTANRTEFQKMLEYCRAHKGRVHWVVVYSVSRFARSVHDHAHVRSHLANLGIVLRSVTEPFDETPSGRCMENMLSVFSQFDNDLRSDRTVAGMKTAMALGKWTFKAPLGYLNGDRKPGSPSLILDPNRAPLVRKSFEMFATGLHTKQKVRETMNAAGLRTVSGKSVSQQTFDQMLRKPVYAGWLVVEGWGERKRGDFEPLVNQELFDRVQSLLRGKGVSVAPRLRSHPDFPLRHFVKCGCCGNPLTASWSKGRSKRYPNYRCQNRQCKGVSVRKEELENRFVEFLERMKPKPAYLKLFNTVVLDVWRHKQERNVSLSVTLKQQIENLLQRKDRLIDLLADKAIGREDYQRRLHKLDEEILLAEMQERQTTLEGYDVEGVLAFAENIILNAARLWTEFSSEQKQRLQKVLFPQGVTFSDGIYRTTETCLFFKLLENSKEGKTSLATLSGIEPELHP